MKPRPLKRNSEVTGPVGVPAEAVRPAVAVDVVALTVRSESLAVLLVRRSSPPFAGRWALPGGFVVEGDSTAEAAWRTLTRATDSPPPGHLEQLRTYGPAGRDPRGMVLTVAHLLLAPDFPTWEGSADWAWTPLATAPELAFDHDRILDDGVERARSKLEYSALALSFCPPEFTISQLRGVYEAVWGAPLDPGNFYRKVVKSRIAEPTGTRTSGGAGRPAELYRARAGLDPASAVLNPPILRQGPAN
jgi:8-oxo-dGTP diphosphatase